MYPDKGMSFWHSSVLFNDDMPNNEGFLQPFTLHWRLSALEYCSAVSLLIFFYIVTSHTMVEHLFILTLQSQGSAFFLILLLIVHLPQIRTWNDQVVTLFRVSD